jgi:hypothetical protein
MLTRSDSTLMEPHGMHRVPLKTLWTNTSCSRASVLTHGVPIVTPCACIQPGGRSLDFNGKNCAIAVNN